MIRRAIVAQVSSSGATLQSEGASLSSSSAGAAISSWSPAWSSPPGRVCFCRGPPSWRPLVAGPLRKSRIDSTGKSSPAARRAVQSSRGRAAQLRAAFRPPLEPQGHHHQQVAGSPVPGTTRAAATKSRPRRDRQQVGSRSGKLFSCLETGGGGGLGPTMALARLACSHSNRWPLPLRGGPLELDSEARSKGTSRRGAQLAQGGPLWEEQQVVPAASHLIELEARGGGREKKLRQRLTLFTCSPVGGARRPTGFV